MECILWISALLYCRPNHMIASLNHFHFNNISLFDFLLYYLIGSLIHFEMGIRRICIFCASISLREGSEWQGVFKPCFASLPSFTLPLVFFIVYLRFFSKYKPLFIICCNPLLDIYINWSFTLKLMYLKNLNG